MEPRRGRLVRPLLRATRSETHAHCESRGLAWREDDSNADPSFARARVREGLLALLREIAPGAERTVAETAALLRDEAELLDAVVDEAVGRLAPAGAVDLAALEREPVALRRLLLRALAERAAGGAHPLAREDVDRILALGRSGSHSLDLGGGLRAVAEYGTLRFAAAPDAAPPEPVALPVPGTARFGEWEVEARLGGRGEVEVSGAAVGASVVVRPWREGDRMRPVGLGGSKTLGDLFTDRKVPRALRRTLPVVEAHGRVVWVAGVALDAEFAPGDEADRIGLSARRVAN
jgi:tRNA(Ile)-lysidine synthase